MKKYCFYHPEKLASATCHVCKKSICTACDEGGGFGKHDYSYCIECAKDIEYEHPVKLLTSQFVLSNIDKLDNSITNFQGYLVTPQDIITRYKIGMKLFWLRDRISPRLSKRIYVLSNLTIDRNNLSTDERDSYLPQALIKEHLLKDYFIWYFFPDNQYSKVAKVTFGIIEEDTGYEYILGKVSLARRPVIICIDICQCDYEISKRISKEAGCKINWKAIKEYGINSDAFAGGKGRHSYFPYLFS